MNSPVKSRPQYLFFGGGVLVLLCSVWLLFRFGTGNTAFLSTMQLSDPRGTAGQWFGTTVLLIFVLFSGLGLYWFWHDVIAHTKAFQNAHIRWETFKTAFKNKESSVKKESDTPEKTDPEGLIRSLTRKEADDLINDLKEDVKTGSRLRRAVDSWTDPSPNSDAEMLIEGEANHCRQKLNLLQAVASILVLIGLVGNFFGLSKAVQELPNLMPTQAISAKATPNISSTTIKTSSGYTQTVKAEDPAQQTATATAQGTVRSISDGLSVVVVSSVFGIGGMIFMLFFVAIFRLQFNHLVGEEALLLAVEIGSAVRPAHSSGQSLQTTLDELKAQKDDVKILSGQLETVLRQHLDKEDKKFGEFSHSLGQLRDFLETKNEALGNFLTTATQTGEKMDSMAGNLEKVAGSLASMVETHKGSSTDLAAYAVIVKEMAEADKASSEARHTQLIDRLSDDLSHHFDQKLRIMVEEAGRSEERSEAIVTKFKEQLATVAADHRQKFDDLIKLQNQSQAEFKTTLAQLQIDSSSHGALLKVHLEKITGESTSSFETITSGLLDQFGSLTEEQRKKWDSLESSLSGRFAQKFQSWLDEAKLERAATDKSAQDLIKDGDSRNQSLVDKLIEQFASVSAAQREKLAELMQLQSQLQGQAAAQGELLVANLKNVIDECACSLGTMTSGLLERFGSLTEEQRTKWDGLENNLSERFAQKLQSWLDEARLERAATDKSAQNLIKDGDSRNQSLVGNLLEQFASVSALQRQKFEELMQLQGQLQGQAAAQGALLETCLNKLIDESSVSFSGLTSKLELQLVGVTQAFQTVAKSSQEQQELLAVQARDMLDGLQSANLSHEQQAQICRDILLSGQQALDSTRLSILELQDQWHVSLEGVAQELFSRWQEQQPQEGQEIGKLEKVVADNSGRIVSAMDALQAREGLESPNEALAKAPLVDFSRLESLLAEQTQLLTAALERGQFHQEEPDTTDLRALENLLAAHSQRIVAAVEMDKDALRAVMSEQAEKIVTAFRTLQASTPPTTNGSIDYARLDSTLGEQAQRIIAALERRALESPASSPPNALREAPELTPMVELTKLAKKTNESLENLHHTLSQGYRSPCLNCGLSNSGRTEYCAGCGVALKHAPAVQQQEPLTPMFASLMQSMQRVEDLLSRQQAAVAPGLDPSLLSALEHLTSRLETTVIPDPASLSGLDQSVRDLTEGLRNFEIPTPASTQSENVQALIDQVGRLTAILEAYLEESKSKKKGWFG